MKIGRKRIYPSHVLIYILLSLWALTTVFPFLWAVSYTHLTLPTTSRV